MYSVCENCAKPDLKNTVCFMNNVPVGKDPVLYPQQTHFMHNVIHKYFAGSRLLYKSYTHNPQSLLLKLQLI